MSISSVSSTGYAPAAENAKAQADRDRAELAADPATTTAAAGATRAAAQPAPEQRREVAPSIGALVDIYL